MRLLRRLVPGANAGLALLAWRHRAALSSSARFVAGAPARLRAGGGGDLAAEAVLRAKVLAEPALRTSAVDVNVENGVAVLRGRAAPSAHRSLLDAAHSTKGVTRVLDRVEVDRRRWRN